MSFVDGMALLPRTGYHNNET